MQLDIMPNSFWDSPTKLSTMLDEEDWRLFLPSSGLTVSEDKKNIHVEAAMPGISPKDIEVTFDKGILWIRGEVKEEEEDKKRKYYHKSSHTFLYRVTVPETRDEAIEPEVKSSNGILKVSFAKLPETQPKKLKVTTE